MFNDLFKAIYGWVSYSIYQKTVSTTIFRQLVPQKAAKGRGVHRIFERGRRGVGAKRRLRGHRDRREQGPGGAAPRKFLTKLYVKPIGYQYRRFKAVDNTLGH